MMNGKYFQLIVLLLTIGLSTTSLSIIPYSNICYIVAFLVIILIEMHILCECFQYVRFSDCKVYALFLISIFVTNSINQTFDYRFLLFVAIVFLTCPIASSLRLFLFKRLVIKYLLFVFVCISVICFICYCIGYNGSIVPSRHYNNLDFRGITNHPMWLAPICGISNIFSLFVILYEKDMYKRILFFCFLIMSFFTSVVAASRSALVASVVVMLILLWVKYNDVYTYVKMLFVIIVLGFCFSHFLDTRRIEDKMEYQQKHQVTSRDELWNARLKEFDSSPLLGIGFATSGLGYEKETGLMESGGGWLSVLSQTGVIGLLFMLMILYRSLIKLSLLRRFPDLLLYTFILFFLCIHSFAEGYIYTPGYNLCVLFWLVIGCLTEAKKRLHLKKVKHVVIGNCTCL